MTPREASARMAALRKASGGRPVFLLSGATRQGVPEVLRALQNTIHDMRRDAAA
jgi:GTP-binding protein